MACESSDWASVNVELLSEALTRVPLRSKVACECVCKAWRRTLGNKPSEGIWGDMVCAKEALTVTLHISLAVVTCGFPASLDRKTVCTVRTECLPQERLYLQVSLQSLLCRPAVLDLSGNNVLISQPPLSSHSDSLAKWVVKRIDGIKQVVLGHPKPRSVLATLPLPDPADDGSFSSTGPLLHLLSTTNVDEGLEVAIFQLGTSAAPVVLLLMHACVHLNSSCCSSCTPTILSSCCCNSFLVYMILPSLFHHSDSSC